MSSMTQYYLSRFAIAACLVGFLLLVGSPWWIATLLGASAAIFFLWAPRSGRYTVTKDQGATALQRDEWTQTITDKSGRNGFVVLMVAVAAVAVYFGSILRIDVPVAVVSLLGLLGMGTYFLSDVWLRRT